MFLKFFGKKPERENTSLPGLVEVDHGIDSEMSYCPSCDDEYRPGIVNCAACNVPLISGKEKLELEKANYDAFSEHSMEISPDDTLVNIRKGPLKDIKSQQILLAKGRVPAIIAGDENSCGKGCCGPEMYLQIKEEDTDRAMAILAQDFVKSTSLDSHDLSNAEAVFDQNATETVCPACGCRFSPTVGACPECGLCFE
jgi:hypothetical protein